MSHVRTGRRLVLLLLLLSLALGCEESKNDKPAAPSAAALASAL